jgi:hypothetical protein
MASITIAMARSIRPTTSASSLVELPVPGVVVVWRDGEPCHDVRRLVDEVIEIDGVRIEAFRGRGSYLEITQRGHARKVTHEPALLRFGDSVACVVGDVRPFENVNVTWIGKLVVAGSLGPTLRALEAAANAEEHISIKGAPIVANALARHYADKLGAHVWFRPSGDQHLDHFLSTRAPARTIVLELTRPLFDHDITMIRQLLETDLRFAVVRPNDHYLAWLPPELAHDTLELPALRFDELPMTIVERVAAHASGAKIRAEAIEHLLDRAARHGEEAWHPALERALEDWRRRSPRELGLADLARDFP